MQLPLFIATIAALYGAQDAPQPPAEVLPQVQKAAPAGALPWEAPPRVSEPILRPPANPREVLQRFDIGPSQIEGFFSGQPLMPSEEDVLVKILYRLPRLGLDNLQRWRQTKVTWDQLAAAPGEHRALVFHVRGRVKQVVLQPLLPEQTELFEMEHYYRVTLDLADSPYRALLLARRVPAAWELDKPLDEPAAADALFLKLGDSQEENPPLIFAAGRVAWVPDRSHDEQQIGPSHVALARLGMDAGQWELVRETNGRGLVEEDREAFYQLLAALGRPGADELRAGRDQPLDIVPLLERAAEHQGELMAVEGLARRVMKVPVSDRDVRSRFGIDHYYEIDLFVSLGNKSLKFGKGKPDREPAVYHHDFPATLIVRELPPGLAEGENLHQLVRADGVFFKIWTYKSAYAAKFDQAQPAPLFVAARSSVIRTQTVANWVVSALVLIAFGLAASVVIVIAWWQRVSDRNSAPNKAAAGESLPPPDFSRLT